MKAIKGLCKLILAGIVAVAILCVLFAGYTFTPIHKANKDGNTDYIWPENTVWFKMTEGISWGRFDANGFNNIAVIENPDILILGSSHMEATDVPQDKNLAYLLNQTFQGELTAYNMGISGHTLTKLCKYLPVSLELFEEEPEYIIMEISNTVVKESSVKSLLEGTVSVSPSYDKGLVATMQKLPFLRLVYQQISGGLLKLFMPPRSSAAKAAPQEKADEISGDVYDALFEYICSTMEGSSSELIILYQPAELLQKDGSIAFDENEEARAMFTEKCAQYGIHFLDMTEPFTEMYNDTHKLPHGFITGQIGTGHLNSDGHAILAKELAETIEQLRQVG